MPDPDTRLPYGERRRAVRQRLHTPVYVSFNTPRSGAVLDLSELLDLHEDGFAVQTAIPTAVHDHAAHDDDRLAPNRAVTLCLDLPETKKYVHGSGQVMWTDDTGRAGIRFSFLPDTSRHALKEWLFANLLVASTNHAARANQLAQQRQEARSFELVSRSSQPEPLPEHLKREPFVMGMPDPRASDPEPVGALLLDAVASPVRETVAFPVRESGASPVSDQAKLLAILDDVGRQVEEILGHEGESATGEVNAVGANARGVAARAADREAVNYESALHFITERAAMLTGASGAALALLAQDHVICRASIGEPAPPVGSEVHVDSGLSGECLRRGILVSCCDTEADSRIDPEVCRVLGLGSFAAVPIFSDFQVVGLLEVFSPYPHTFATVEETILKRLAEMVPRFDEKDCAQEILDVDEVVHEAVAPESVEHHPIAQPSPTQLPPIQPSPTLLSITEPAIIPRETQRPIPQRPATTPDAIQALGAERLSEPAREQVFTPATKGPESSFGHALEPALERALDRAPNPAAGTSPNNPAAQTTDWCAELNPADLTATELTPAEPAGPLARRFPFSHVMLLVMAIAVAAMALGYLLAPSIEQHWLHPAQSAEASSPPPAAMDRRGHALSTDELRKLADQGDPDAEWQMGILYHDGEAVPKDDALAVRWFELAAAQGYVRAQSTLGAYYWAGRGVPQDLSKAYFWSQLALAQGDEDSKSRLEGLSAQMTQPQVAAARQQAEAWLRAHNQRANSKAN